MYGYNTYCYFEMQGKKITPNILYVCIKEL